MNNSSQNIAIRLATPILSHLTGLTVPDKNRATDVIYNVRRKQNFNEKKLIKCYLLEPSISTDHRRQQLGKENVKGILFSQFMVLNNVFLK